MPKTRTVLTQDDLNPAEQQAVDSIVKPKPEGKKWSRASAKGKRKVDARKREAAHETRAQEVQESPHDVWDQPWSLPGKLPPIPARPGMVQRWIRVANGNEADVSNASSKMREGWVPRPSTSLPKGYFAPTLDSGKYAGGIGVAGLVLMEMPASRNDQRNAFFKKKNNLQTESVNQQLAEESRHGIKGFGNILKAERTDMGTLREVKTQDDV